MKTLNYYEKLLSKHEKIINIYDYADLGGIAKGLYVSSNIGSTILIDKRIKTTKEKHCILAEELGHYYVNVGNIYNQRNLENIKEEKKGQAWAYKNLLPVHTLIKAYRNGVRNKFELAEYANVTEEFIENAISYYRRKYGCNIKIGSYNITLEPNINIMKD